MRKEIKEEECREQRTYNQAPTGHRIPTGRSADDPGMAFRIPDCGHKAGGQFSTPFEMDDRDLPGGDCDCGRNRQGF